MCGASLTITCPVCQFVNPVNYRFCGMCGSPLLVDEVQKPVAPVPSARFSLPARGVPTARPQPGDEQPVEDRTTGLGAALDGERRVATVIFADVKGSTELLEQIGTEAWVEVMNNVFQVLETEIYRYSGEVGQFRGDGLVAFFGAKVANEDDPQNAVMAALAMQEAIKPYAADLSRREGIDLSLRVGVNTGEIIVASVGNRQQYSEDTPMGEALTVSSRMETAAEPGTVLVSENTYRLVRNDFEWLPLGEIYVKGISHPIPVYRPLAPIHSPDSTQESQIPGFPNTVIGRKKEIKVLKKTIDDLYGGRGGIVLVSGIKGMGKSFLVTQLYQRFARHKALLAAAQSATDTESGLPRETDKKASAQARWMRGRCRSYSRLRPYSLWLDLLHEWLGIHPEDQASQVQAILRAKLEPDWGSDIEKDYPNLATFLSTPVEETSLERVKRLDAEGLKREFFQTVCDWMKNLASQGPIVVSLSDLQWADETSLELLKHCLALSDTEPILWLLVFRPERDTPVWELQHYIETNFPHRLTHLPLPPLTKEESEEFIDQYLGHDVLFPETRNLILKKAEGNPFFIKELIFSLIADGVLVKEGEPPSWVQTRPVTSLDLPDSLQSLLMARIDRLSPGERRVLQMAAVIGSVFWMNAIQALAGPSMPVHQIKTELVSLQRAGLIHERTMVDDLGMEYSFDSSLIREVAYESLLNPQRVAYHQRVAEFLEEIVFREGKRGYFNTLAHHYRLAGDIKKELFYTNQAAERAQSVYANAEALRYYTRALELLDQIEEQQQVSGVANGHSHYAILTQKFEALNGRRAVSFLMGNIEEGWRDARALLTLARQMEQDKTWLIDALLQQPGVAAADSLDELLEGIPLALEALELSRKIGDKRREMNSLLAIASQRNLLNDPTWNVVGDQALEIAREIGDRQYEAMILLGLGHAYIGRDELEKGTEYLNAAIPICEELDDKVAKLTLLQVLGAQYERSGDHYERLVHYEQERLELAREMGDRFEEGNALMFCGQIQALNLGDLEAGLAKLRESLQIMEVVSNKIFPLLRLAQIQIALGQFEDARQTLEIAQPVAERNVYDLGRVGLKMVTILLYNALGDAVHLNLALDVTGEIMQMEERQLISRQYLMAAACEATASHLGLARLAVDEADRKAHIAKSLETSQLALDIYNSFGYVSIIECSPEEIFWRCSLALSANGRQDEAVDFLKMAYNEMMRKYEMIPADSHYRRTFLENLANHREIRAAYTAASLSETANQRNS
mgnify:CR=1 FL=1